MGTLLALSPLSSHSIGSPDPELPDTTLFVTVFFKTTKPIFRLYGNKSETCRPIFRPYGYLSKTSKPVVRPYRVRGLICTVVSPWMSASFNLHKVCCTNKPVCGMASVRVEWSIQILGSTARHQSGLSPVTDVTLSTTHDGTRLCSRRTNGKRGSFAIAGSRKLETGSE